MRVAQPRRRAYGRVQDLRLPVRVQEELRPLSAGEGLVAAAGVIDEDSVRRRRVVLQRPRAEEIGRERDGSAAHEDLVPWVFVVVLVHEAAPALRS